MKTLIILVAIIILLVVVVLRKNRDVKPIRPFELVELDSVLESRDYLPKVPKNWLTDIENEFDAKELNDHPNEYSEITDKLCSQVYANSKYWENNLTHADFLNCVTKEQRILFALVNFEGQTNNGGVYQFLFNQPELSFAALDAMLITKMDSLAKDYEAVLHELQRSKGKISELKAKFNDNRRDWISRWNAFVKGYNELKTAAVIEGYFYNDEFIRYFRSRMIEFVKSNHENLFIEEE